MRLVVFVLSIFFVMTPSFAMAEQKDSVHTLKVKSNVKLRDIKRHNLEVFQDSQDEDPSQNLSELANIKSLNVYPGYFWWIGRKITFNTVIRGRKKTGYILLSNNCNMRKRSIVYLYRDTWRPGQYKYFNTVNNPRNVFRCLVKKIVA